MCFWKEFLQDREYSALILSSKEIPADIKNQSKEKKDSWWIFRHNGDESDQGDGWVRSVGQEVVAEANIDAAAHGIAPADALSEGRHPAMMTNRWEGEDNGGRHTHGSTKTKYLD